MVHLEEILYGIVNFLIKHTNRFLVIDNLYLVWNLQLFSFFLFVIFFFVE